MIRKILVSQPKPSNEKSPYYDIAKEFGVQLVFRPFIKVEGITAKEFRNQKVNILEHTAIVFTSRHAIDHFFTLAKELRLTIPEKMRYFCVTETVALYIQKYVQYRKRKVFYGNQTLDDLIEIMKKHKDEKYLYVCSDISSDATLDLLTAAKLNFTKAVMFRTVPADLKDVVKINDYDMLVFFSPMGIHSLKQNFPDFEQKEVAIGGFGDATCQAIIDEGFELSFRAPTQTAPSMTMAIEEYIAAEQKKSKKK